MPNTKSAERRVRSNARKSAHNSTIKSRLHNLERKYMELVGAGKKDDATAAYRQLTSTLDKAAKTGVIHRSRANRAKSRLGVRLHAVGKTATPSKT
jgi:small subunit ribosomal protein S20